MISRKKNPILGLAWIAASLAVGQASTAQAGSTDRTSTAKARAQFLAILTAPGPPGAEPRTSPRVGTSRAAPRTQTTARPRDSPAFLHFVQVRQSSILNRYRQIAERNGGVAGGVYFPASGSPVTPVAPVNLFSYFPAFRYP